MPVSQTSEGGAVASVRVRKTSREQRQNALQIVQSAVQEIHMLVGPIYFHSADSNESSRRNALGKHDGDELHAHLTSAFDKIISSLAAAVNRMQLTSVPMDESSRESPTSALMEDEVLEYMIEHSVLLDIIGFATHPDCPSRTAFILRWNLLRILETLVSSCLKDPRLISQEAILLPMLAAFDACAQHPDESTDKKLVAVINEIAYCLRQAPELVQFFVEVEDASKRVSDQKIIDFRLMSYLYPHLGQISTDTGKIARTAVLALLRVMRGYDALYSHLALSSRFCDAVIAGLVRAYGQLPKKRPSGAGWAKFETRYNASIPELQVFTESIEFLNAVVQLSQSTLKEAVINKFIRAFLLELFIPTFIQHYGDDLIAGTAYLEYMLATLEPTISQPVARLLISTSVGDRQVLDLIVGNMLSNNSGVVITTISLLTTLLDMNYQPLLDHLIFRFLNEARPTSLCEGKLGSEWADLERAEILFGLTPVCCRDLPFIIDVPKEAKPDEKTNLFQKLVKKRSEKTELNPPTDPIILPDYIPYLLHARERLKSCWTAFGCTRPRGGSGREDSMWFDGVTGPRKLIALVPELEAYGSSVAGPFIAGLLYLLDRAFVSDFFVQLHVTGILSRLLVFPQSHLWDFLMRPDLKNDSVGRSLFTILKTLIRRADTEIAENSNGKERIHNAYAALICRVPRSISPSEAPERRMSTLPAVQEWAVESVEVGGAGSKYSRRPSSDMQSQEAGLRHRQLQMMDPAVIAVVLNEFLQELAAVCQERAILCLESSLCD